MDFLIMELLIENILIYSLAINALRRSGVNLSAEEKQGIKNC